MVAPVAFRDRNKLLSAPPVLENELLDWRHLHAKEHHCVISQTLATRKTFVMKLVISHEVNSSH